MPAPKRAVIGADHAGAGNEAANAAASASRRSQSSPARRCIRHQKPLWNVNCSRSISSPGCLLSGKA
jgi:hypothetical protein